MATLKIKDSDGVIKYLSVSGAGTVGDPYLPNQNIILKDEAGNVAGVDNKDGALIVVDALHNKIHDGDAYRFGFTDDMASAAATKLTFVTPADPERVHFRLMFRCELEAAIILYEDVDTVVGGSAITPLNANRNSTDASGITVLSGVTSFDSSSAIELINSVVSTAGTLGDNLSSGEEFVLKPGTTYGILITNQGGADNNINLNAFCYLTTDELLP